MEEGFFDIKNHSSTRPIISYSKLWSMKYFAIRDFQDGASDDYENQQS